MTSIRAGALLAFLAVSAAKTASSASSFPSPSPTFPSMSVAFASSLPVRRVDVRRLPSPAFALTKLGASPRVASELAAADAGGGRGPSDLDECERSFLYGARDFDEHNEEHRRGERKFLYGAREEKTTKSPEKKKAKKETDGAMDAFKSALGIADGDKKKKKKGIVGDERTSAIDAARAAWESLTARKEEKTPAERHRDAVAASQKVARAKREEGRQRREEEGRKVRAAAESAWEGLADSFAALAWTTDGEESSGRSMIPDDFELPPSSDVDEHQLNRLLVHADKILSSSDEAEELLGGKPVASLPDGNVLSRGPSSISMHDGSRPTEGIRAFVEVRGPKRSGMATVVGDKRGVLLMKLTVGGRTLDLRTTEGLYEDLAHGTKKGKGLRP